MATKKSRKAATPKIQQRSDLKHARTSYLSDESLAAYDRLGNEFKSCYMQGRWMMVNIAIKLLDKTVKERGLKAGDNLEAILGV